MNQDERPAPMPRCLSFVISFYLHTLSNAAVIAINSPIVDSGGFR